MSHWRRWRAKSLLVVGMPSMADTQLTEIFGRNRLINDLLRSAVGVATPVRDRGVDLIAYVDLDEQIGRFAAVPIQIKTAMQRSFSIDRKYAKVPDLLFAFVWGIGQPETAAICALTYPESLDVGKSMGWLDTESWIQGGRNPGRPSISDDAHAACRRP